MTEDEEIISRVNELMAPLGRRRRAKEAIRAHTTTKEKVKSHRRARNRQQEVLLVKGGELREFLPEARVDVELIAQDTGSAPLQDTLPL